MQQLESVIERIFLAGARLNFSKHGHVVPILAYCEESELKIKSLDWEEQEDKVRTAEFIKALVRAGNVKEFILIAEAWQSKGTDRAEAVEFIRKHGSLETYPGRDEAIMLIYYNPEKEIHYTASISRNPDTLGPWQKTVKETNGLPPDGFGQRFSDFFRRSVAGLN